MKLQDHPARVVGIALLTLVTIVSAVKFSRASIGNITKADLAGPWRATLIGNTGCGLVSMLVTFTPKWVGHRNQLYNNNPPFRTIHFGMH